MATYMETRILSRPARVLMLGFESTTYQLQQAGWEISMDQDVILGAIRMLMRHQGAQLLAASAPVNYDFMSYQQRHPQDVMFVINNIASRFEVLKLVDHGWNFNKFEPIDAMTQITYETVRATDDLKIFARPLVRTEEIIVEPQTVTEMLEKIRAMQSPEQDKIRERNRLRDARNEINNLTPRQNFHAQIISLA